MSEAMAETEFYALEALTSLEEQLETLQREHASCHESYDVVLRTWRDRALAAEASSPASEPEAS